MPLQGSIQIVSQSATPIATPTIAPFPDLANPAWGGIQGIGTVISLILAVAAILIALRPTRPRKSLMYQVISEGPLRGIKSGTDPKDKIGLNIAGTLISDPEVVLLKFVNTGQLDILPSDYVYPIELTFNDNAIAHRAYSTDSSNPNAFKPKAVCKGKTVTLKKALINEGDWFDLQIIGTHLSGAITVTSHIAGIKKIEQFEDVDIRTDIAVPILGFILRPFLYILPKRIRRVRSR